MTGRKVIGVLVLVMVSLLVMQGAAETVKITDISMTDGPAAELYPGPIGASGDSLQSYADSYSPTVRMGWSVVVNGEQSSPASNWQYGYGQINAYDSSNGVLSGPGYLFSASIGQAGSPAVKSLGPVMMAIHVQDGMVSFRSGSQEEMGSYSLTKGTGKGVFYGPGTSPAFASPMCILELETYQPASGTGSSGSKPPIGPQPTPPKRNPGILG